MRVLRWVPLHVHGRGARAWAIWIWAGGVVWLVTVLLLFLLLLLGLRWWPMCSRR